MEIKRLIEWEGTSKTLICSTTFELLHGKIYNVRITKYPLTFWEVVMPFLRSRYVNILAFNVLPDDVIYEEKELIDLDGQETGNKLLKIYMDIRGQPNFISAFKSQNLIEATKNKINAELQAHYYFEKDLKAKQTIPEINDTIARKEALK